MKKNGFISSALLYGMLALFLVITLTTLAVLGNRKLGMDQMKKAALNTIRFNYAEMKDIYLLYDSFQMPTKNVWKDQSGNSHDATLHNLTVNDANRFLSFNGTDNYIDTGVKQSDFGDKITISMVMKITDFSSTRGLWGWYGEGKGIYANISPLAGSDNGDTLNFCYYDTDNQSNCVSIMGEHFKSKYLNKLVQISVVITSKVGIDVYINGVYYDSASSTSPLNPRTDAFIIGKDNATSSKLFKGELYNFCIYSTNLNYEEIIQNFEADKEKYNIP